MSTRSDARRELAHLVDLVSQALAPCAECHTAAHVSVSLEATTGEWVAVCLECGWEIEPQSSLHDTLTIWNAGQVARDRMTAKRLVAEGRVH